MALEDDKIPRIPVPLKPNTANVPLEEIQRVARQAKERTQMSGAILHPSEQQILAETGAPSIEALEDGIHLAASQMVELATESER
ncbi:hypothetical protein HYZ98_04715 [Candidatus Peregrinibacteria bacterium]|nr:hypothetical protein [Candidatus Peregrinibacteria bacterium]